MNCKLTQAGESLLILLHTWSVILDLRHTCGRKARRRGKKKKSAIKCIFVLFPLASGGLVCCQSLQETKGGERPPAWLRVS